MTVKLLRNDPSPPREGSEEPQEDGGYTYAYYGFVYDLLDFSLEQADREAQTIVKTMGVLATVVRKSDGKEVRRYEPTRLPTNKEGYLAYCDKLLITPRSTSFEEASRSAREHAKACRINTVEVRRIEQGKPEKVVRRIKWEGGTEIIDDLMHDDDGERDTS